MTSPHTTFKATVAADSGLVVTKSVPAGISGPFSVNPEARSLEQVLDHLESIGFDVVSDWEMRWGCTGPFAEAEVFPQTLDLKATLPKTIVWDAGLEAAAKALPDDELLFEANHIKAMGAAITDTAATWLRHLTAEIGQRDIFRPIVSVGLDGHSNHMWRFADEVDAEVPEHLRSIVPADHIGRQGVV